MKIVNYTNPHRQKHFDFFERMSHPHFNVCANVDITFLRKYLKENNLPFTPSIVYLICKTANSIPSFRHRIRDGKVVEHDLVHPSFTILIEETDVFSFCYVDYQSDYISFIEETQKRIEKVKADPTVEDEPGRDDYLFLSSFPWASFTSVMHAMPYDRVDTVPRIVWGKFFEEGDRIKMPLSVQAHHAVVDGHHIGQYFQKIESLLEKNLF